MTEDKIRMAVFIVPTGTFSNPCGHIPGAVSFPHREMSAETTAQLDRSKVYVVYCDGIGCNASTKGAYKLARLGFRTKELLGGIDWWRRDGHPVAASHEPGSLLAAE